MIVSLYRASAPRSGGRWYGRPEIFPRLIGILIIRMYGFGPRHTSHTNGMSSPT